MKEDNHLIYHIKTGIGLLRYLDHESAGKHSKMAAFRDLLEQSLSDNKQQPPPVRPLLRNQIAVTVSGLAKRWNWHRATVSKFLSVLEQSGAVRTRQHGGFLIVTMTCIGSDEEGMTASVSEEEQCLNRWLCGYLSIEELTETAVHFITETDRLFVAGPSDGNGGGQDSTGSRLHRLIAHIILQRTGLIPQDRQVNEALQRLFINGCDRDLARFLQRLTLAGLQLLDRGKREDTDSSGKSGTELSDDMNIILRHYLPFIGRGMPPCAGKPADYRSTSEGGRPAP